VKRIDLCGLLLPELFLSSRVEGDDGIAEILAVPAHQDVLDGHVISRVRAIEWPHVPITQAAGFPYQGVIPIAIDRRCLHNGNGGSIGFHGHAGR
jgi:hypothetical protein